MRLFRSSSAPLLRSHTSIPGAGVRRCRESALPCVCAAGLARRAARRCCAGAATPKAARRSSRPTRTIRRTSRGFDVEIAELIAQALGRTPQFVQVAFASIDQSVARGDFDIGLSGIEDTPARRATLAATVPYYRVPRSADRPRRRRGALSRRSPICAARRVGTLGGTIAYDLLLQAEREHGIVAVSYDDDVHPYRTCWSAASMRCCSTTCSPSARMRRDRRAVRSSRRPVAIGHYVGVSAPANAALRDASTTILLARDARRHGSSGSSASGTSGTTTSRSCTRELLAAATPSPATPAARSPAPRRRRRAGRRRCATCRRCCARR